MYSNLGHGHHGHHDHHGHHGHHVLSQQGNKTPDLWSQQAWLRAEVLTPARKQGLKMSGVAGWKIHENPPFIEDFTIQPNPSIYRNCPLPCLIMFDCRRVYPTLHNHHPKTLARFPGLSASIAAEVSASDKPDANLSRKKMRLKNNIIYIYI